MTAQLVDATSRSPAWAERFDRKLEEILEVDDEVTEAIVAALQPALRRAEAERARRAAPEDLTAWSLVNRAWVAVQSDLGSVEAAESAVAACEEALRRDPEYAFAHAVLGHARSLLAREGLGSMEAADAAMRRALELGADDPLVHHCHAALLGNFGRTAEGVRAWERALDLDPNSAGARAGLGIAQIYLRRPERALASIDEALRLSPRDPITVPLARAPRAGLPAARPLGRGARGGGGFGRADRLTGRTRGAGRGASARRPHRRGAARLCRAPEARAGPRSERLPGAGRRHPRPMRSAHARSPPRSPARRGSTRQTRAEAEPSEEAQRLRLLGQLVRGSRDGRSRRAPGRARGCCPPRSSATPYSVTTLSTVFLVVVTTAPGVSWGRMRESVPSEVVERSSDEGHARPWR